MEFMVAVLEAGGWNGEAGSGSIAEVASGE